MSSATEERSCVRCTPCSLTGWFVPPVHDALTRPVAMSAPAAQASTPLGEALEKTIWELHQLEKIIELGASSDDRVIEKIEDFAKTLQPLREAAEKCDDEVPVELLREVDQGKKPMGFMINQILAAGNANEVRQTFTTRETGRIMRNAIRLVYF